MNKQISTFWGLFGIVALAVLVGTEIIIYDFSNISLDTINPVIKNHSVTQVFSTQEECEKKNGCKCSFEMCDYIPAGKTFEEVCGKDFKKGWQCINQEKDVTADWKTYKNEEYSFEIKYPADLCSVDDTKKEEPFFDYNITKIAFIDCKATKWTTPNIISIYADSKDKNIQNCLSGQETSGSNIEQKSINGYNFSHLNFVDAAMGGHRSLYNKYSIINNNKCFQIVSEVRFSDLSFLEGVTDKKFTEEEKKDHDLEVQQEDNLVSQIVLTFKF